jgi:hypothetical protein
MITFIVVYVKGKKMIWAVNLLGSIFDYIFAYYVRYIVQPDKKFRFFRDGFGDMNALIDADVYVQSLADESKTVPDITVSTKPQPSDASGNQYDECSFTSPAAFFLPSNMCTAYFQLIRPPKDTRVKGVIIYLPHAGDEWYESRKSILDDGRMINKGYVGVLPMVPFHGKRRGESQTKRYTRTVELWFKSFSATVIEAASLVRWVHKTFPGAPVCVAGASRGGAMACFTACVAQDPISIVSVVGFDTHLPYLTNPSTIHFDWEALMADRPGCSRAAVRDELFTLFSQDSHSTSIKSKSRARSVLERAVCVNARNDAWVNSTERNDLENALRRMTGDNVSIESVYGGHIAVSGVKPGRIMNPAIISAFNHQL